MFSRIQSGLTYANVMATVAVFLALGGGAYAAIKLPKNSVGTKQLKRNAVNSSKVRNKSLAVSDFSAAARAKLKGATGPVGPIGPAGPSAADAPVPGGKTIRGLWGGQYAPGGTGNDTFILTVGFPLRAPTPLTDATAQVGDGAAFGGVSAAVAAAASDADEDPACAGSYADPTAPAGKLCLYVRDTRLANVKDGSLHVQGAASDDAVGATARTLGLEVTFSAAVVNTPVRAQGAWAYTAP
jgi:hypothetical protein